MSLDLSKATFPGNGAVHFDEESALIQLLEEGVLFVHSDGDKTVVSVNASDVFMWACADGEDLPYDQIEPLYRRVLAHGMAGKEQWLCIRRNSQPQACVARDMKAVGAWSDEMAALPENRYDIWCREQAAKRAAGGAT